MTSVQGGSLDDLARDIATLKKKVKTLSRKPQLTNSAIDDGAVIVTADGVTTAIVGVQFDGATEFLPITGPVPPVPTMPSAVSVVGGIRVTVPGTFADTAGGPVITPTNFSRFDIEVSTDPSFPEFTDPRAPNSGSVISASGGQVKVGWPTAGTPLYVRTRTRTTDGQRSAPSLTFGPVTSGAVGLGDLGFDLKTYVASNSITYGTAAPTAPAIGALWVKEVAALPVPQYETWRWTGAQWVKLTDQGVTDALVAASAAQAAADAKAKVYTQTTMPSHSGAAGTAVWFDSDDGNAPYRWDGTTFLPMRLGNGAIQPNSLVASNVVATGTITAALLETLMVLTTAVIAGDPAGENSRLDSTGLRAFATDEGLPIEIGYFGRGLGVRDPETGQVVGGITEKGQITGETLDIAGEDPSFGGVLLSEMFAERTFGGVAYAKYPAIVGGGISALTNGELGFIELGFEAQPGRSYGVFIEPLELVNVNDPGGAQLRVRATTDGTAPTISSPLVRSWSRSSETDAAWNDQIPYFFLYNGPVAGSQPIPVRMGLSYAIGTGTAGSLGTGVVRNRDAYFWIVDFGPTVPETGDETSMSGTTVTGGAAPAPPAGGTTTKQNYTYQRLPNWQRTWAQNGTTIINDNELQQGYGDSFNGNRRSAAGWTDLQVTLAGATVNEVAFYLESYWWWNLSGGVLRMGYHGNSAEPGTFPGQSGVGQYTYTARTQGKWIVRNDLAAGLKAGTIRGISLMGADNSATYYSKFRGDRIYCRVKYTK